MLALASTPILFSLFGLIVGLIVLAGIYRMNLAGGALKAGLMAAVFLFVVLPAAMVLLAAIF